MDTQKTREKSDSIKYAVAMFMAVSIFVVAYKYALNDLAAEGVKDLKDHLQTAEDIYLDRLAGIWLTRPYLFWFLCVKGCIKFLAMPAEEAAACTCGAFAAFGCMVQFYIIDKITERYLPESRGRGVASACMAGILSFVGPLYMWWFNIYQYEGQFTINPYFNATHMAVKPIGLLCFAVGVDIFLIYREETPIFFTGSVFRRFRYVIFGVLLFWSVFTKPTFLYMLLPTGFLFMLTELGLCVKRKAGKSGFARWGKEILFLALSSLPALAYLGLEYAAFYLWGGTNSDAHVAIYPFLTAWHIYSPDVPTSIILGMAFPLWMLITNLKYFFTTTEGRLSLLGYAVGTLEFSFVVETGDKLGHLNFSWPMMSGMLLFWVVAGGRLLIRTLGEEHNKRNLLVVCVGWLLLFIHLYSGFYYINPYAYIL